MDEQIKALQAEIKTSQEAREATKMELEALKKSIADGVESPEQKAAEKAELEAKQTELGESINKLGEKYDALVLQKKTDVPVGAMAAITDALNSAEFKSGAKEAMAKKGSFSMDVEVKLDSSTVLTPVSNTQIMPGVYSTPDAALAFFDLFASQTIPTGKSQVGYIDASFTDNTGYAEEMQELTAANAASAEEKTRLLAKVGTFMPFSAEMIEDNATVLTWAQQKSIFAIRSKVDTELWKGAGADDASNKRKIYGLKGQGSTAFSATTAAVKYEKPNLADLTAACITQIEIQGNGGYTPTAVLLHPADYAELAGEKNTMGNYLNILPGGSMTLHGLEVRKSVKMNKGEMAVVSRQTLMLADKRTFTIELERVAKTDSYILWVYWRGQGLVTTPDKLANVYVSNIGTALTAITKA